MKKYSVVLRYFNTKEHFRFFSFNTEREKINTLLLSKGVTDFYSAYNYIGKGRIMTEVLNIYFTHSGYEVFIRDAPLYHYFSSSEVFVINI
jgi:hypothetical protein